MTLHFSHEERLLGTGGGIRRVADFLRESDPCLIVGGDMLLDADLGALCARHRETGVDFTLLLREDPRRGTRVVTRDDDGPRADGNRFGLDVAG